MGGPGGRHELVVDAAEHALRRIRTDVQGPAMEGGAEAHGRESTPVHLLQQHLPELCIFPGHPPCGRGAQVRRALEVREYQFHPSCWLRGERARGGHEHGVPLLCGDHAHADTRLPGFLRQDGHQPRRLPRQPHLHRLLGYRHLCPVGHGACVVAGEKTETLLTHQGEVVQTDGGHDERGTPQESVALPPV